MCFCIFCHSNDQGLILPTFVFDAFILMLIIILCDLICMYDMYYVLIYAYKYDLKPEWTWLNYPRIKYILGQKKKKRRI